MGYEYVTKLIAMRDVATQRQAQLCLEIEPLTRELEIMTERIQQIDAQFDGILDPDAPRITENTKATELFTPAIARAARPEDDESYGERATRLLGRMGDSSTMQLRAAFAAEGVQASRGALFNTLDRLERRGTLQSRVTSARVGEIRRIWSLATSVSPDRDVLTTKVVVAMKDVTPEVLAGTALSKTALILQRLSARREDPQTAGLIVADVYGERTPHNMKRAYDMLCFMRKQGHVEGHASGYGFGITPKGLVRLAQEVTEPS